LAELQILKEGKEPNRALIVDYAIKIRRWLDRHKSIGSKILAGAEFYQYNNRIVFKDR
jgi:hypothetical protein